MEDFKAGGLGQGGGQEGQDRPGLHRTVQEARACRFALRDRKSEGGFDPHDSQCLPLPVLAAATDLNECENFCFFEKFLFLKYCCIKVLLDHFSSCENKGQPKTTHKKSKMQGKLLSVLLAIALLTPGPYGAHVSQHASDNTKKTHVIVVGAGVSGLAAAHALLEKGFAVTLLERGLVPGGLARTGLKDGKFQNRDRKEYRLKGAQIHQNQSVASLHVTRRRSWTGTETNALLIEGSYQPLRHQHYTTVSLIYAHPTPAPSNHAEFLTTNTNPTLLTLACLHIYFHI
eukprot:g56620.t1